MPTIVFHGDRDTTVNPVNSDQVIAQSKAATNLRATVSRGEAPGGISRHPGERCHWLAPWSSRWCPWTWWSWFPWWSRSSVAAPAVWSWSPVVAVRSAAQQTIYRQIQRRLNQIGPYFPLIQPTQVFVSTKDLKNAVFNAQYQVDVTQVSPR